jgi:hypothetical protein
MYIAKDKTHISTERTAFYMISREKILREEERLRSAFMRVGYRKPAPLNLEQVALEAIVDDLHITLSVLEIEGYDLDLTTTEDEGMKVTFMADTVQVAQRIRSFFVSGRSGVSARHTPGMALIDRDLDDEALDALFASFEAVADRLGIDDEHDFDDEGDLDVTWGFTSEELARSTSDHTTARITS